MDRSRELDRRSLTLVRAAGGSGKSTLARAWRDAIHARGGRMAWLPLTELHRDPTIFVEDLVDAIREVLSDPLEELPSFGDAVLRTLPRGTDPSAHAVVDSLCRCLRTLTRPLILCLDAFEQLDSGAISIEIVDLLLRRQPAMLRLVVTTRGLAPSAVPRLLCEGQAEIIDAFELSLRSDQIAAILRDEGVEPSTSELAQLLARTRGWAIAVRFAARAFASAAREDRAEILRRLDADEHLFRYIASELIDRAAPELVRTLEIASLLGPIDRATLTEAIATEHARMDIDHALESGLLRSSGGRLSVHGLLADWLRRRMKESHARDVLDVLHDRLGSLLERRGHALAALRLHRLAGRGEAIGRLLARHGHDWVAEGHREITAEALSAVPEAMRSEDPALIALQGLVASGADPDSAIDRLKQAIEMYRRAGNRRAEFEAFHQLSIIAMNENRMDEVIRVYRHALTLRRVLLEPELRGMLVTALGLGSFVIGRQRLALRLLATADTYDLHPRERGGLGLVRSLILFFQGDWDRVVAEVDERCHDERQRRHGTTYHAMQTYRAAVLGFRGLELEACRAALADAIAIFAASRHSLVAARAHLMAGHLAGRVGDGAEALDHFARAAALCRRIRLREGEAAALAGVAQVQRDRGDRAGALESARTALALVSGPVERTHRRVGIAPYFATGCALAAYVAAELGDAVPALRFFARNARAMRFQGLPLCGHAIGVLRARVHELAGQPDRARADLIDAERIRRRAGLRDHAPELSPEILRWSTQQTGQSASTSDVDSAPDSGKSRDSASRLALRTLGGLDLLREGRLVALRDWRGTTTRRLLVRLLVAEGHWLAREQLEADLWPEAPPTNARNNLRVALSRLRDVLEPARRKGSPSPYLRVEGERVALGEALLRGWDVRDWRETTSALDRATTRGDAERAGSILTLLRSQASRPFVPEIYDDWASAFRREHETRWSEIARRTSAHWLAHGHPELAEAIAALLLERVREDEAAWSLLIEARLARNDRSGAARAYRDARDRLRDELGLEPGEPLQRFALALGLADERSE